jgi:hypothetical protein
MGPGDVELALREAKGDFESLRLERLPDFEKPLAGSASESWVQLKNSLVLVGMPCEVRLGFYRGQLLRVALTATFPGDKANAEKMRDEWRDKMVGLLTEKYGKPARSEQFPDSATFKWPWFEWHGELTTIHFDDANVVDRAGQPTRGLYYEDPVRTKLAESTDPAEKNKL